MFKGFLTFRRPKITLSRLSSGMTAFVAAGFLVYAILDGNGGTVDAQRQWDDARERSVSIVDKLGPEFVQEWKNGQDGVDRTLTQSILKMPGEETSQDTKTDDELSVLSLIRENADVAPAVSSGTDRVSVIVKPGDTLYGLARRHGLKVNELARLNGLQEPYVIRIGQTLYVAR